MPVTDPEDDRYDAFNAVWRGIDLSIRHCSGWCAIAGIDHIEVISGERVPLPNTGTGYKSHFISPEQIAEVGSPMEYVLAWLEHAADSTEWKKAEFEARQLSLF